MAELEVVHDWEPSPVVQEGCRNADRIDFGPFVGQVVAAQVCPPTSYHLVSDPLAPNGLARLEAVVKSDEFAIGAVPDDALDNSIRLDVRGPSPLEASQEPQVKARLREAQRACYPVLRLVAQE